MQKRGSSTLASYFFIILSLAIVGLVILGVVVCICSHRASKVPVLKVVDMTQQVDNDSTQSIKIEMYEAEKQYTPHKDAEIYATGRFSAITPRSRRTTSKLLQTEIMLGIDALKQQDDQEFDDGFQGDKFQSKSNAKKAQYVKKRQSTDDIEKGKTFDSSRSASKNKSVAGIRIGVLPINEENESVETDRGNVTIKEVIKELAPVPRRHQTSEQLPNPTKPEAATNYFSQTGMMFFPDDARTVDKPVDGVLDRSSKSRKSPSSANSSDFLGQDDDIDSMINLTRPHSPGATNKK